jgi:beta-glucanase (GH16 family)
VFRDDFDGTSLDQSVWTPKEFWEDEPRTGAVAVSGGTLKVRNARPYLDDQSVTTGPYWFGDPVKKSWQFGYFETRMKFTGGRGSWPAFWLISKAHATWQNWPSCPEPDLNFELDIFEFQGDEPTRFYGTQHRNTGGVCGTPNQSRSAITNPGPLADGWHTYAAKWTATSITWYVDGVQQGQPSTLFDSGDQPMYVALTMQACGWDSTNSCTSATPDPLVSEFDYVSVWQQ